MTALIDDLRATAHAEGFSLIGVTPAVTSDGFAKLVDWIEAGYAGQMQYFLDRKEAYRHPSAVLQGVRSIIAMTMPYSAAEFNPGSVGYGRVARYAWSGVDYHDVIHPKLKRLCKLIVGSREGALARGVVDTAPLPEREIAELAGLGWRGKNTLLLNKQAGSYFFLGFLLTNLELPYDAPHVVSHCGSCTACLEACPTDAFPQAGVLDATRCISYLTIEHRDSIDVSLRERIGDWLFGCDVCQEVCPWNRKPSRSAEPSHIRNEAIDLRELMTITEDEFRKRYRKTPLWRPRRRGMLRNAAIVLGNQRDCQAIDALIVGLGDDDPVVRGASAWALGRIGGDRASDALEQRRMVEHEEAVKSEILEALSEMTHE